ncbi:M949_RS01915 family surface polysaccharide biosynthesis protein [Pseudomonas sp. NPDC089401]|uniref:M949_RS01915 family surface polysaccharide biosynthesis protein n=1 Tax=Pseudomonas sp. NPDC089401 TaxID=3364462 RepID=UPI00382F0A44
MPLKHRWLNASLAMGSLVLLAACEQKNFETLPPIPVEQLEVLGVQTPLKSVHFHDRDGEGLLVLSRSDGQAVDAESEQEVDKVVLKATLYGRAAASDAFKPRWQIEQETTCPGLDLDVDFYGDVSDVSDLDKDGIAEVTVASHAFCGGGIDPHDIAIEMRQGQASYTITGHSLITPAGEQPIGGDREDSASLKSAPAVLREHMEAVWQQVYKRPWSETSPPPDDDPEDDSE